MKCLPIINSEVNALDSYKDECAWWVVDAEIEGSKTKGACAVLEVAAFDIDSIIDKSIAACIPFFSRWGTF